jgi:ABC-2 type transport system permease protein
MSGSFRLVRAELLKVTTIRAFWWSVAATLAFVPLGVSFAILGAGRNGNPGLDSTEGFRNAIGSGNFGGIMLIVLGVLAVTGEFRFNTANSTFLISPRRRDIVTAKISAIFAVAICIGLSTCVLIVALAIPWLENRHVDLSWHLGDLTIVLLGVVGSTTAGGVLGVGIGWIIRNQTAAITITLVWAFVIEAMVGHFAPGTGRWLPIGASSAMSGMTPAIGSVLPIWAGALVLAAYSIAFSAVGARLLLRNDIL